MNYKLRIALGLLVLISSACVLRDAFADPIDDLEPGHWYEIPNSKLSSVTLPGANVIPETWNGAAYDTINDRLIEWGGGHSDYSGNEVYSFDLASGVWSRITNPSPNVSCDFSVNEYPDGNPCAMHTYEYVEFHPGANSLVLLGGASPYPMGGGGAPVVHRFDLGNRVWSRGAVRSGGTTLQGASSAYDSARDLYWVVGAYDQRIAAYSPTADVWTQYGSFSVQISTVSAVDRVRDLLVILDGGGHNVFAYGLASPNTAPVRVATVGADAPEQSAATGFEYDPTSDRFVAWVGGTSVYTLAPPDANWQTADWTWEEVLPAPTNSVTPTARNQNGTYSKWRYVPSKNVFILLNRATDNLFVYRLGDGIAPPPPPKCGKLFCTKLPPWPPKAPPPGPPDPPPGDAEAEWNRRASAPGVVYANDFRTQEQFDDGYFPDSRVGNISWDSTRYITGGHSARFAIKATDSENSGNWRVAMQPSGIAFGQGSEFYVSYALYSPAYFVGHRFLGGGGWKTSIISEYDYSYSNHEVVLGNSDYRGYPRGYFRGHAQLGWGIDYVGWDLQMPWLGCNADPDFRHQPAIDRGPQTGTMCEQNRKRYGGLYGYGSPAYGQSANADPLTGAAKWQLDGWQTLLQHVKVGHFGLNDSTVEVWMAPLGEPYTLLYSDTDAILGELDAGEVGYDGLWLTPFDTGKDPDATRQDTFINYDQVIISTQMIEAPR